MNVIDTQPRRRGFCSALARTFERWTVSFELRYLERDIAFERSQLDALPAKVRGLEQHAEHLRVMQAVLRSS